MRMGMTGRFGRAKGNFCIFLALVIIGGIMVFAFKRMQPVFEVEIEYYANRLVTGAVNDAVTEVLENDGYSSFSKMEQNGEKRVTAVETDTAKINRIRFAITKSLRERLDGGAGETVHIPLGSLSGFYVLNGIGPEIPVKISPVSMISTDFTEDFKSAGINQVKHSLSLNVGVTVEYTGFLMKNRKTINTQVPVIETVISGDVPQYYGTSAAMTIPEEN